VREVVEQEEARVRRTDAVLETQRRQVHLALLETEAELPDGQVERHADEDPVEARMGDGEDGWSVGIGGLIAGAALRTLLYVEDNPANLKLVERLIARRPDMCLLTAIDGTIGVDLARSAKPEVILMDINLPGISGIEALKILRGDPATAHIPVVALSANAVPHDVEKGLEAGFFRYLTKPIKVAEFMDTLSEALDFVDKSTRVN